MRAAILLAWALWACLACGPSAETPGGEPWPISAQAPGVLGYAALPAAPEDIAEACRQILGWAPDGLSGGLPVALLILDEKVFGSPLAFSLPIDDEDAFRASLAECSLLRHVRGDSWVFTLSGDHPAMMYLRMLRSLTAAQSPADLFAAARLEAGAEVPIELVVDEGRATLAPSFEASLVTRRVLRELPGFSLAEGPIVLSFDARRFHLAYQEEIAGVVNKARGLLLGVQMAGFASMMQQMRSGGQDGADLGLPIPGDALWAMLQMLSIEEVEGLQLSLHGRDGGELVRDLIRSFDVPEDQEAAEGAEASEPDPRGLAVGLRLVWAQDSAPARLLEAVRPVAGVPGAASLGFDPTLMPQAVAEWSRPLVELTMGEGPPSERLMQRIAELLAPCQGTLIAGLQEGGRALAIPLRGGEELDGEGMGEVLGLFARTLGLEDNLEEGLETVEPWDGFELVENLVPAQRSWQSDGVCYVTFGQCAPDVLDQLAMHAEEAAVRPRRAAEAPFLNVDVAGVELRAFAEGNEFILDLPLAGGQGW